MTDRATADDAPTARDLSILLDRFTTDERELMLGMIHATKLGLPMHPLPGQRAVLERMERKLLLHRAEHEGARGEGA